MHKDSITIKDQCLDFSSICIAAVPWRKASIAILLALLFLETVKGQASGTLDLTFNGSGSTHMNYPNADDISSSIALSASGTIYTAGRIDLPNEQSLAYVTATLANGQPNTAFSLNGKLDFSFGSGTHNRLSDILIQPDGRILVCGEFAIHPDSSSRFAIARLNPDGTFDPSFALGGKWVDPAPIYSNGDDFARSLTIDQLGRSYCVGQSKHSNGSDFRVSRYLANGTPDMTFGNNGNRLLFPMFSINEQWWASCTSVLIQDDGKIIMAGSSYCTTCGAQTPSRLILARLEANGNNDPSFGTGTQNWTGLISIPYSNGDFERAADMAIQENHQILVVGVKHSYDGSVDKGILVRVNPDGTLDTSIGPNGRKVISGPDNEVLTFNAVSVQRDDKILCAGNTVSTGTFDLDASYVHRFLSNGSTDPTFGQNGYAMITHAGDAQTNEMIIDTDDKILLTGSSSNGIDLSTFLIRLHSGPLTIGIDEPVIYSGQVLVYPNPISESATICFTLESPQRLTMELCDQKSCVLATYLNNKQLPAGEHIETISLPTDLASGNYLLVFSSPHGRKSIQVTK